MKEKEKIKCRGGAPVPARRRAKVQMNTDAYIKVWRCLFLAMLLVCVASSAGGEVRAIVKRVQVEGARSVSARDVRGWLVTRAGVAVDSALLRKDVHRILKGYQARGFWHVAVAFPRVAMRGDDAAVAFAIVEGARTRVASVEIKGDQVFDPSEVFGLARGMVLLESDLDQRLDRLLRFYEDRGYPFCALRPDVRFDSDGARVQVVVSPGPLVNVDAVRFEGNQTTREDVLLRHISFVVGEVYDQRRVDAFVRQLQNLPFIDRVYTPELVSTGDEMVLVIGVEESRHTRIEGVLGVGSGQGLTGEIALDVLNFSGGGREGYALWSRRGVGLSNLRVSYREPYVLNSPLSGWGAVEMVARMGYVTHKFGGGADVSVGEGTRFFGGVVHRRVLPDSSGLGFFEAERMWSLESGVRFGRREGAMSGWQAEIRGEVGEVSDGIRRVQWGVDGQVFLPVGKQSVIAGRARAFWVGQKGDVPQTAGIWLGGAQSLRGYREEMFWGTNAGWVNVEWRWLLDPKARLFAFVDAGRIEGAGTRSWPVSYGVGLLANGRMGAVGIDYGLPRGESLGQGMVHVRMISAF